VTRLIVVSVVALSMFAGACSSDSDSNSSSSATTTTTLAPTDQPVYEKPGPYKVGYTSLDMDGRGVSVWYPADEPATAGKAKAFYDQRTPLPKDLQGLVPDEYNTRVTMDAYDDVKASSAGPFPVVLFSHGFGAYRQVNSASNVGIASWGFVVASVDYTERGIVTQVRGGADPDATRDERLILESLDLIEAEGANADSVLSGAVDGSRAAVVGHSAGGGTAYNALSDPRVKVAVGYAPVPPADEPVDKPTMIIGAEKDSGLTPSALAKTYASFPPPKRWVEIGNAGHNTFTDLCDVIRSGGGLLEFARKNKLVSERLLDLGQNGCRPGDLEPAKFLPVVQHFTVAQIRESLGIDPEPVGLGDGITTAFPGISIKYEHQP
jgi:dienelactone hydrolase